MATKKRADPMRTRTGKPRLGPLNIQQLEALLEKTNKKKDRAKIINRLDRSRRANTKGDPDA